MKRIATLPALVAGLLLSLSALAQHRSTPPADQLFRKRIWRQIDLREKQNKPMFAQGTEISRILIEAVKRGEIQAYRNDSLTSTFTPREVSFNMSYGEDTYSHDSEWDTPDPWAQRPGTPAAAPMTASDTRTRWTGPTPGLGRMQPRLDGKGKPVRDQSGQVIMNTIQQYTLASDGPSQGGRVLNEYRYRDLYELELHEDLVFDKRRSRMVYEIKTITLHVPAGLYDNVAGIERPIATFRYSDVVKVFRANPETAIWYNTQNAAEHRNLADAFALRLFSSYITKVSNPEDKWLADFAGSSQGGITAAQQQAAELVEYEYNLWSF